MPKGKLSSKLRPARRMKGNTGTPVISVSFERHADKKKGTITGLSAKGIAQARAKGRKLPRGPKVKGYYSPVTRAASTLKLGMQTARRVGVKTYVKDRPNKALGMDGIHDLDAIYAMIEKAGAEEPVLRKWLDGKIPTRVMEKPEQVADRIIRDRVAFGKFVFEWGAKDIMLRNLSHSWILEAVFERLTGRRIPISKEKGGIAKPTEGFTMAFNKKGRAILSYRGKKYDVTANLNKIIAA